MTALPDLAVTGATGVLGGMVARQLSDAGFSQRLLVRDPRRAPELEDAPSVPVSYGDPALSRMALEGVKVLFMVSAAEARGPAPAALRLRGRRRAGRCAAHCVHVLLRCGARCTFTLGRDHYATEERIRPPAWPLRSCGTTSTWTSFRCWRGGRRHPGAGGRRRHGRRRAGGHCPVRGGRAAGPGRSTPAQRTT